MTKKRQYSGDETITTLKDWIQDQKTAERLAGSVLHLSGFIDVDPSHPLGGPDGIKDIKCKKGSKTYIVGVYFPRTQQSFARIKKKFEQDFVGVAKNKVDGLIFFTNQHLSISERAKLTMIDKEGDIFHRERIALIINSPIGYGVRLEYLGIEMSKDEQISFFAQRDVEIKEMKASLGELLQFLSKEGNLPNIPTEKLQEFKSTLIDIVGGPSSFFSYGLSPIDRLRVPLNELKEFQRLVGQLTGFDGSGVMYLSGLHTMSRLSIPLQQLKEFKSILEEIVGSSTISIHTIPTIQKLFVPLNNLKSYLDMLDITLEKLKEINKLREKTGI